MYINERGQVNYHSFLKALRERNKALTSVASRGICTPSGWNRFENGNRLGEKLMKDRLVARLGVSGEKYEDYLQPREYSRWQQRMRIVRAIEAQDLQTAKQELATYEALGKHNRVNIQFIKAMHYMILCLEGASEEVLWSTITAAVKCTVPSVKKALEGAQLLSDQEVNLIAEQMRLAPSPKSVKDATTWRITEYEKLIDYMDASYWEKLQKAKVYPKVAHFIGELLLEKDSTEQELRRGLDICHTAMEFLRDTSRSFYLVELAKARISLAARLLTMDIEPEEKERLKEMMHENAEWADALQTLCEEHGLQTAMSDFCYLYYETECYNMVEVIEKRRKMLGISRARLTDGICTERTLIRCEREGTNLSVDIMRAMFERLGLCAEYRRAQMVTTDVDAVNKYYNDLAKFINDQVCENALECIGRLKTEVDMSLPYNRQEIERQENRVLYLCGKINADEFSRRIFDVLGYTVNVEKLDKAEVFYFTRTELACLHDIAFEVTTSGLGMKIIEQICDTAIREEVQDSRLYTYEYIVERLASELGNNKRYKESNEMSGIILKECLQHYRIDNLASLIYNHVWNYQQDCGNAICDNTYIGRRLQMCQSLSELVKKYNAATFFQKKRDSAI